MSDYRIFIGQYGNTTRGEWVDAADVDACEEVISRYSDDGAIEVGVFDHEGFGGIRSESVSELRALAEYLDGRHDADARLAYADNLHLTDPREIDDGFDDAFVGEYRDAETFAEEIHRDCYGAPEGPLANYIDWERYARDLFIGDFWSAASSGGIFVFRNC